MWASMCSCTHVEVKGQLVWGGFSSTVFVLGGGKFIDLLSQLFRGRGRMITASSKPSWSTHEFQAKKTQPYLSVSPIFLMTYYLFWLKYTMLHFIMTFSCISCCLARICLLSTLRIPSSPFSLTPFFLPSNSLLLSCLMYV